MLPRGRVRSWDQRGYRVAGGACRGLSICSSNPPFLQRAQIKTEPLRAGKPCCFLPSIFLSEDRKLEHATERGHCRGDWIASISRCDAYSELKLSLLPSSAARPWPQLIDAIGEAKLVPFSGPGPNVSEFAREASFFQKFQAEAQRQKDAQNRHIFSNRTGQFFDRGPGTHPIRFHFHQF